MSGLFSFVENVVGQFANVAGQAFQTAGGLFSRGPGWIGSPGPAQPAFPFRNRNFTQRVHQQQEREILENRRMVEQLERMLGGNPANGQSGLTINIDQPGGVRHISLDPGPIGSNGNIGGNLTFY